MLCSSFPKCISQWEDYCWTEAEVSGVQKLSHCWISKVLFYLFFFECWNFPSLLEQSRRLRWRRQCLSWLKTLITEPSGCSGCEMVLTVHEMHNVREPSCNSQQFVIVFLSSVFWIGHFFSSTFIITMSKNNNSAENLVWDLHSSFRLLQHWTWQETTQKWGIFSLPAIRE